CGLTQVLDHCRCDCRHCRASFACRTHGDEESSRQPSATGNRVNGFCGPEWSGRALLFRFRGKALGLGDPAIGPARKTDLFADLERRLVIEFGKLPIMENAEVVELLFDRPGYAGELLEVIGRAARAGQSLEARSL